MKNNEDSETQINKRLDAIISILLNQQNIEKLNQTGKINYLTKIGFKNNEIASILGISIENVKATRYRK
jgi:DNA-binding CsgD family transcriptional regulator